MRNTLVMVVLAALAVATWLYGRQPTSVQRTGAVDGAPPLGYYLRAARLLGTDEQGRVAYQILADDLEELPDQQLLTLRGVRIEYHPADADTWLISAETGTAPKDGTELTLRGAVTLRSQPRSGGEPMTIAAEALRFVPEDSTAESDTPVSIRVGDWDVSAVGLRTRLKGDVVQLESKVHAKFTP
ncbi:MAG TPA: LPS export ABC transporter periplasmic protein LptC [Gammaproteobacteria bacterium]|nr:LPS export ABC transporter periplasmic protein LptC [Gammaproteobacteria bacterium]